MIYLAVSTEYRGVADRRRDSQTDFLPRHSQRYAYVPGGKNSFIQIGFSIQNVIDYFLSSGLSLS